MRNAHGVFNGAKLIKSFDYAHIVIDGKPLRALRIVCFCCGKSDVARINTFKGAHDSTNKEHRLAAERFSNMGWDVGSKAQRHRCPKCVERKIEQQETTPMKTAIATFPPPSNVTAIPKQMGRDDRRIIFEKLNEFYVDERSGYAPPWTDKKLAVDLGVPQGWVAQVREEMFGPVGSNSEIDSTVVAGAELLVNMRAIETSLLKQAGAIKERAADIERRLIDIQKAVRP